MPTNNNNPHGHVESLVASHPGNHHAGKSGIWSPSMRRERSEAIFTTLMQMPHVLESDRLACEQIARETALIEVLVEELERIGLDGDPARVALLLDYAGRAEGRLSKQLDRFGTSPLARAKWLKTLAGGQNLSEEIARRRNAARGIGEGSP